MKRYYRRIAPLLSGNYILPSPAHYEISTPHLLSNSRGGLPEVDRQLMRELAHIGSCIELGL